MLLAPSKLGECKGVMFRSRKCRRKVHIDNRAFWLKFSTLPLVCGNNVVLASNSEYQRRPTF